MIGRTVGSYRITGKIGDGGMGEVFLAVDDMLGREAAIKLLHPELARQPDLVERFRNEAVILARLSHPNIATLYGLFREGSDLFMAMEYIRGQTLEYLLLGAGRLSWERAADWGVQTLAALDYAHRTGVVHRDLKPANLMVTIDGSIKVMDFGIARVIGADRQTRQGRMVGTLTYMAPEQVRGQAGDSRTDLYAMGVVLYELVTGRPPFSGEDEYALMQAQIAAAPVQPALLASGLPGWMNAAILEALAKDPAERFQTAGAFRDVLERGLRDTTAARRAADVALQNVEIRETKLAPEIARAGAAYGTEPMAPSIKETRLAPELAPVSASQGTERFTPVNETRLAPDLTPVSAATPARATVAAQHDKPSGLRRLNWRHYVSASALLVILSVAIALVARSAGEQAAGRVTPPAAPERQAAAVTPGVTPADAATAAEPVPPVSDMAQPNPGAPPEARVVPERLPATWLPPAAKAPAAKDRRPPAARPPVEADRPPAPAPAPPAEVRPSPPPVTEVAAVSPPPPVEAPPAPARQATLAFQRVQVMILAGEKSREKDALLRFEADRLSVVADADGEVVKAFAYKGVKSATYSQSKHPRWKEGGAVAIGANILALPAFFLKSTRHWLTIQTADDFVVLRLDKNDYRAIIPALEARTGIKVEVMSGDK